MNELQMLGMSKLEDYGSLQIVQQRLISAAAWCYKIQYNGNDPQLLFRCRLMQQHRIIIQKVESVAQKFEQFCH